MSHSNRLSERLLISPSVLFMDCDTSVSCSVWFPSLWSALIRGFILHLFLRYLHGGSFARDHGRIRRAEPNSTMAPITKGLVLRSSTTAKCYPCIFSNDLATWPDNSYSTSNMQRPIGARVNCGFLRLQFLWTIVKPLKVQCSRWAGRDHFGDLIH